MSNTVHLHKVKLIEVKFIYLIVKLRFLFVGVLIISYFALNVIFCRHRACA